MERLLFQDNRLRHCNIKGIYEFKNPTQLLEILNTFQRVVPKEKHILYPKGQPEEQFVDYPSILPCTDGILLKGVATIDGDQERATIGAIIYRPDTETLSGLYLITLEPKPLEKSHKVENIKPELPGILKEYILETIHEF